MNEDYPRTIMELERRFSDENACRAYLYGHRWPDGFVCPHCGGKTAWAMKRGVWLCRNCRGQVSVLAGTVFQDTHLPLTAWFRAIGHVTSPKNGVSALGLQGALGLGSYKTAWAMLHKDNLHGFIGEAVEPGSTVRTDGLNHYMGMTGYIHDRQIQRDQAPGEHLMPRVHRVVSRLKRWPLGTHQGAIGHDHLDYYLDEFTFRFNRRKSASRSQLFYRLVQQAVQVDPAPFSSLIKPQHIDNG